MTVHLKILKLDTKHLQPHQKKLQAGTVVCCSGEVTHYTNTRHAHTTPQRQLNGKVFALH